MNNIHCLSSLVLRKVMRSIMEATVQAQGTEYGTCQEGAPNHYRAHTPFTPMDNFTTLVTITLYTYVYLFNRRFYPK